jgi:hypothetical protein
MCATGGRVRAAAVLSTQQMSVPTTTRLDEEAFRLICDVDTVLPSMIKAGC